MIIPFTERVCDFCNSQISNSEFKVVKSFVLTDWGAICFECWDSRVEHPEEFDILKPYAKGQVIEDSWARMPMIIDFPDEGEPFFLLPMNPRRGKTKGDSNG